MTVDAACPGGRKFKTEWRGVDNLTLNGDGDGEFEHVVSVSLYVPSFFPMLSAQTRTGALDHFIVIHDWHSNSVFFSNH